MLLGQYNSLTIVRFTDHGAYLDGGEVGEILMPKAYVKDEMRPGDIVQVFVYLDQQERLVGTTETPLGRVGEFVCLRCSWVNKYGAFLDWGLLKDLFVPFREQKRRMEVGQYYVVRIYIDDATQRIVATAKLDRYLQPATPEQVRPGQEVALMVQHRTDLGYKVIVDNQYAGLIYFSATNQPLGMGSQLRGYVSQVRPDGKLDISLQPIGVDRYRDFAETLWEELLEAGGQLPYCDNTPAETIADRFGVSKKTFKRAVGNLYKAGKIILLPDSIARNEHPQPRPSARSPRKRFESRRK